MEDEALLADEDDFDEEEDEEEEPEEPPEPPVEPSGLRGGCSLSNVG